MILDSLRCADTYFGLGLGVTAGLSWLQETDLDALEPGKHEIPGTACVAIVSEYDTKPLDEGRWEAHRNFIDIQVVVSGVERIGRADVGTLSPGTDYDAEKDLEFLNGDGDLFTISAGEFAVLWPHDAHMPCVSAGECSLVRKIVVKVPV